MDGKICTRLHPVVGVNVLDFRLFPQEAEAPLHITVQAYCPEAPQLTA